MRCKIGRSLVIAGIFVPVTAVPAPVHPECPWVNPNNLWKNFITGNVPPSKKGVRGNYFSVRFDHMKHIKDSKSAKGPNPLGNLWKGSCYVVEYRKGGWTVMGYNKGRKETIPATYRNADPNKNEISLWGIVFKFNEDGRLIHKKYGHIGSLYCVLDYTACDKYG